MQKVSLDALARELLERAATAGGRHTASTVVGGHELRLRQTLVAMMAGAALAEHESPGESTLYVVRGRVKLSSGDAAWEVRTGDLLIIPPARHDLVAVEDSAMLLTVVKSV